MENKNILNHNMFSFYDIYIGYQIMIICMKKIQIHYVKEVYMMKQYIVLNIMTCKDLKNY